MKRLLTIAAGMAAAAMMSAPANAGVVSFADYAAGNEHGINDGDSVTIDGVSMTFYAGNNNNYPTTAYHPYFDDYSGGRPAGLGVCRSLTAGDQCADAGDDSIDGDLGIDEFVIIDFNDGPIDLVGISFRDGEHFSLNDDDVNMITYEARDGAYFSSSTVSVGTVTFADFITLVLSGEFLNIGSIGFAFAGTEFYIESMNVIPIPGALPLLLSGLAGLGFAARRKKKVA